MKIVIKDNRIGTPSLAHFIVSTLVVLAT